MSPDVLGWLAGGLVTLLAAVVTTRMSRKTAATTAKVGEITAASDAAKKAQEIYGGIVADLRQEVDRLNEELVELRRTLETTSSENAALKAQVATMQRTVNRMTRLLEQHSIPLPMEAS